MRVLTSFILSLSLMAAVAAPAAPVYRESTGYLPELETAETLRTLDRSFRKTIPLVETFEQASRRLDQLLSEYRADPTIEREGRLERELSTYVSRIVELIDNFVGDRDEIAAALTHLERDLARFRVRLAGQRKGLEAELAAEEKKAGKIEAELAKLARQAQADPGNRELRREFRDRLRALRLQERYLAGYRNNARTMEAWSKNMEGLASAVTGVKEQVVDLLDSLEQEKRMLASAVRLRGQRVNIAGQLSGGFVGQGTVLANLADRIRVLYQSIEKFTGITEEMDVNLGERGAVSTAVAEITEATGAAGVAALADDRQLDYAIDFYANK